MTAMPSAVTEVSEAGRWFCEEPVPIQPHPKVPERVLEECGAIIGAVLKEASIALHPFGGKPSVAQLNEPKANGAFQLAVSVDDTEVGATVCVSVPGWPLRLVVRVPLPRIQNRNLTSALNKAVVTVWQRYQECRSSLLVVPAGGVLDSSAAPSGARGGVKVGGPVKSGDSHGGTALGSLRRISRTDSPVRPGSTLEGHVLGVLSQQSLSTTGYLTPAAVLHALMREGAAGRSDERAVESMLVRLEERGVLERSSRMIAYRLAGRPWLPIMVPSHSRYLKALVDRYGVGAPFRISSAELIRDLGEEWNGARVSNVALTLKKGGAIAGCGPWREVCVVRPGWIECANCDGSLPTLVLAPGYRLDEELGVVRLDGSKIPSDVPGRAGEASRLRTKLENLELRLAKAEALATQLNAAIGELKRQVGDAKREMATYATA